MKRSILIVVAGSFALVLSCGQRGGNAPPSRGVAVLVPRLEIHRRDPGRKSSTDQVYLRTQQQASALAEKASPLRGSTARPSTELSHPVYFKKKQQAEALYREAGRARARGDVHGALSLYRRSIELRESALLRLDVATLLDESGRKREALEEYDTLYSDSLRGEGHLRDRSCPAGPYARLLTGLDEREATAVYRQILKAYRPSSGGIFPWSRRMWTIRWKLSSSARRRRACS